MKQQPQVQRMNSLEEMMEEMAVDKGPIFLTCSRSGSKSGQISTGGSGAGWTSAKGRGIKTRSTRKVHGLTARKVHGFGLLQFCGVGFVQA